VQPRRFTQTKISENQFAAPRAARDFKRLPFSKLVLETFFSIRTIGKSRRSTPSTSPRRSSTPLYAHVQHQPDVDKPSAKRQQAPPPF
jgi:hypothetical protein